MLVIGSASTDVCLSCLGGSGSKLEEKVILLKPQTFMNLSGEAIKEIVDYYKIALDKLIVIYDDIDIEPGIIKLRKKGGAGTHNGMKSVINELGSNEFIHIRIGTGKPLVKYDLINYVIGKLSAEEYKKLENGIETAKIAVEMIVDKGIDIAMNQINHKNEGAK